MHSFVKFLLCKKDELGEVLICKKDGLGEVLICKKDGLDEVFIMQKGWSWRGFYYAKRMILAMF